MIGENLLRMEAEVREMKSLIAIEAERDNRIGHLFKGFQIYISPIFPQPKVLFLGINPGSGYYNKYGKIVQIYEPLSRQDTGYGPWAQLEYCFNAIGKLGYLDTIVKTNAFFLSTKNEPELRLLLNLLSVDIRNEFSRKSKEWVNTIISELRPANIICGGASALRQLKGIYPQYLAIDGDQDTSIGRIGEVMIFSYKRRYSNIKNRGAFIRYLDRYLR